MTNVRENPAPRNARQIGTFADAKRKRKEHIEWLRQGDKTDRRLAKVLAQCRKGNRCILRLIEVSVENP